MQSRSRILVLVSLALLATGAHAADLDAMEAAIRETPNDLRLGSEYRQAAIDAEAYDRAIEFFDQLSQANPRAENAFLNLGFAYVDKVRTVGAITQVILAERALEAITAGVEIQPSWIGYYSRGNAYLFWPKVFGRAPLAVKDMESAMEVQESQPQRRSYHVRTFIGLGDAYWKTDQLDRARETWAQGLQIFPGNQKLEQRLALEGEALETFMGDEFDPNNHVDTSLRELWEDE